MGHILKVEGKHEEKSANGEKYVSKQFSYSYTLPGECKVVLMTSCLTDDKLAITIPKETSEEKMVKNQNQILKKLQQIRSLNFINLKLMRKHQEQFMKWEQKVLQGVM